MLLRVVCFLFNGFVQSKHNLLFGGLGVGTLICYNSLHELHLSEMYGHEIFLSSVLGKPSLVSVSKTVIKVQDFCCLCIVCSSVMHFFSNM